VGNLPPGGSVFCERSKAENSGAEHASAKPIRPTVWAFWFCQRGLAIHCFRLAPLAENATAQRSVAHLTITNTFWRSVQTCSVLLHTKAGGTPAFQSAPLRGNCRLCRQGRIGYVRMFHAPLFSACSARRKRNRLAVGYPPYVCWCVFRSSWGRGQASPLQRQRFLVLPIM
jgi:hypothetical protein